MRKNLWSSLLRGFLLLGLLGAWGGPDPVRAADCVIRGGPAQGRKIALTFDDGPTPQYTLKILALLKRYQAHATFFLLGRQVERYPWLARQEVLEGHEAGNHSFSHPRLTQETADGRERELERTAVDLDLALWGLLPATLFRPPFSAWDDRLASYLAHTGRRLVLWTVDSGDWRGLPAEAISDNVLSRVRPGAIVIFHDGDENCREDRRPTVEALETILPVLHEAGYQLVTVSQLVRPGSPPSCPARAPEAKEGVATYSRKSGPSDSSAGIPKRRKEACP